MEDEWHVSDSEGGQEIGDYTQYMISNLKGLCTVANQDINSKSYNSSDLYIPKNANSLYTQVENNGFIALRNKGSKRRLIRSEHETYTPNDNTHRSISSQGTCNEDPSDSPTAENEEETPCNARSVTKSEFDYDEDMIDAMPTLKLPKRKPKSEHNKYYQTKRVGTMEKVISNLNRFERLNCQVMAAESTT